jgi:hypothetical protein
MISIALAFCAAVVWAEEAPVPVYRYWQPSVGDHFYTTSTSEIGDVELGATGNYGYIYEGIGFYIASSLCDSNTALYRYYQGSIYDHFYTTSADEIGTTTAGAVGNYGYTFEGILGYCDPAETARADMVPLYRYYNSAIGDHFYTISYSELGAGGYGWSYEGIQCYVYSSATAAAEDENVANTDDLFDKERSESPVDQEKITAQIELFGEVEHMPLHSLQAPAAVAVNRWVVISSVAAVLLLVIGAAYYKQCAQKNKGEEYTALV